MAQSATAETAVSDATRDLIASEIARQLDRQSRDVWHDPASAAKYANCSKANLLRCIRQGRGPDVTGSGRMMRMRQSAIDAWLEGKRHVARASARS
jgi:hypothetical protein